MKTKKQDNTIITEKEKIAGQDQGGSIVPQKDISSPPTVKNPSPKQGEVKPTFDMQTMINDLNAREEEALKKNEDERKKESRYHRARSIISAIGDGLSGLANIYFTTKGAPDMLKGTTSLSAKQQERWDKIRKEREVRREAYLKAVRDNNRESLKNAYTQWKDNRDYELKVQQEEYLAMIKAAKAAKADEFVKFADLRERKQKAETEAAEERVETERTKQTLNKSKAANAGRSGGSGSGSSPSVGKNYIIVDENEYKLNENGDILYKNGRPIVVGKRTRRLYKGTPEYDEYIGNRGRKKGWTAKK